MIKGVVSVAEMVERASAEVNAVSFEQLQAMIGDPDILIVDIRDLRELWRGGKISGAKHSPRGMLEFWVDPQCSYHKPEFAEGKTIVFYCASAWRSALAVKTVQDMGLEKVNHLEGGFSAWRKQGGEIEPVEKL